MRYLRLRLAWALLASAALPAVQAAEPTPLFNGHDLAGWVAMHDAKFEAREGRLRLLQGQGWLRSEKEYGDFVLELEARPQVERYDSGLLFRAGLEGKPWPTEGWQVNLRRDLWGALIKGVKTLFRSEIDGPDIEDDTPWSKFRLEVRGAKAKLTIDGKPVWETDQIDRPRGYVGIQAENRAFEFRNLRLQELTPSP